MVRFVGKPPNSSFRTCEMTTTLKTSFGVFRGKNGDGVVQYLGIKYASLKNQLAVSEMVKDYGAEVVDATNFG